MQLDDYILSTRIGEGAFGAVFLTKKNNSNLSYATKKMDRTLVENPKFCKYFVNEVSILRNVYHKNIVKIEDLKKTKNHYYIIMEYCNGGSLKENLEKYKKLYGKPFPEKIVQHIMRQIVSAIKYLHGLKIVHRDLKLDNILSNYSSEEDKNKINLLNADIKIVDFGFATHISNVSLLNTTIGSPFNMDPLILQKYNCIANCPQNYDEKADIWSLGTLCYQMFVGDYAFFANNTEELGSKIEEGNLKIPFVLSRETISFLLKMLQYDPKKRSSAEELYNHPFLINCADDFSYIDLRKVMDKINYDNLIINIKKNETICSIVNDKGDKQLVIPQNELVTKEIRNQFFHNNPNLTKQDLTHSAPFTRQKITDPVLNQLLDIKVPQKEQSIIKSLVLINEKPTNQTKKSFQPLNQLNPTKPLNQNNTYNIPYQGNPNNYIINPSGINNINQNIYQSMPITQQKQIPKNAPLTESKKTPIQQNILNNNNQNKVNQINNNVVGSFRTNSSQNLQNLQFRNYQEKFNTMMPLNYSSSKNQQFDFRKINSSDKQIPNINANLNNVWKNQFPGTQYHSTSSKHISQGNLNFMNIK